MTPNQLAKELARREGLKKQVDIAQIKELIGHLSDIFYEMWTDNDLWETTEELFDLGRKRAAKRAKKGKKK
jgi:hypothetical protein